MRKSFLTTARLFPSSSSQSWKLSVCKPSVCTIGCLRLERSAGQSILKSEKSTLVAKMFLATLVLQAISKMQITLKAKLIVAF